MDVMVMQIAQIPVGVSLQLEHSILHKNHKDSSTESSTKCKARLGQTRGDFSNNRDNYVNED